MSKPKIVVLIGIILIVVGVVLLFVLKEHEYRHIIGGSVIGAGGGCLAILTSPKTKK